MASYNTTLILLDEREDTKNFLFLFHEQLKSLGILIEKENSFLVYNEKKNHIEPSPIELTEDISDFEIINLLSQWKGLGILEYSHPDIEFIFSINYLSWDGIHIEGIDITAIDSFLLDDIISKKFNNIIFKIIKFLNYEIVVGNISNLDLTEDLESIKKIIRKKSFEIDSRTW